MNEITSFSIPFIYALYFVVLGYADLRYHKIPNKLTVPVFFLILATAWWSPVGLWWTLAGGAVGFGFMLIMAALYRVGGGDVKLMGLAGMAVGFPLCFLVLGLGILAGALTALPFWITRKVSLKDNIPFGTSLAVVTIALLIWGTNLVDWIMSIRV